MYQDTQGNLNTTFNKDTTTPDYILIMQEEGETQTKKITVTLDTETLAWLQETYPDALGDQEAIRMAINDSRTIMTSEEISISD